MRFLRTLRLIWKGSPGLALAGVALLLIQAAVPLILLYSIKLIFDTVAVASSGPVTPELVQRISLLIILAGAISVLQSVVGAASRITSELQAQAVKDEVQDRIQAKSVAMDLGFYHDPQYRDSLYRAQQYALYRPARVVLSLHDALRNAAIIVAMAGLLATLHWAIIPILILSGLPGLLVRMRNAPAFYDWERRSTPLERQNYYLNDLVTSPPFAEEIRLYDLGGYFRQRARDVRSTLRALARRLTYRRSLTDVAAESVAICGMFGVFLVIGTQTLNGAYSIGSLVITFQALQRVWTHFGQLMRSLTDVRENDLLLAELFEFFDLVPTVADGIRAAPGVSSPPQIVLEDVCFRYPGAAADTLNRVSLTIQAGQQIALVGHNGSGKSTLIKLLCRLYDPPRGKIMVDGVDMREMQLADIRAMIGVMTQDFVRYEATAADNIRFGRIDLPPEAAEVVWAAQQSGADAVIRDLPQGYETMLGTLFAGGHQLSAGQWQKVAMARALIRKPRLLILDEPTSAMDANAEQALFRTFRHIARGCTSVVVSHRLANITGADCIYVLEEGSIVESGTHTALMTLGGLYAHMFELQARGYR